MSQPTFAETLLVGYALVLAGTTAMFMAIFETSVKFPGRSFISGGSFGLYVYQGFLLKIVTENHSNVALLRFIRHRIQVGAPIAFAGTVLVAALSYQYFESGSCASSSVLKVYGRAPSSSVSGRVPATSL